MLTYLIEATLCWAVFYGFYALLLSRTTFFRHNRWYLLATLLLGLLIPLAELPVPVVPATEQLRSVYLAPVTTGIEALEVTVTAPAQEGDQGWLLPLLQLVYWAGVALALGRFLYGLWQIHSVYRGSKTLNRDGYRLVLTDKPHLPFAFFNLLFWSRMLPAEDTDRQTILRHELAHIRQGHSYDMLLLEILGIFFWCSPLVYLYRRTLKTVHEYLADAAVLRNTRKKQYGHLLIRQSLSGMPVALANHFAQTQLKKRIIMMTRHRTPGISALRYTLAIPLTIFLLLAFANPELISQTILEIHKPGGNVDKMEFADDEAMKRHLSSMDPKEIASMDVRKGDQTYVTITLRDAATESAASEIAIEPEGPMVVEVHHPDGSIKTTKEFPSRGQAKEFLAGIQPDDIERVDVRKGEDLDRIVITLKKKDTGSNPALVGSAEGDRPPRFPGCEDLATEAERNACSLYKLQAFLGKELRFPATAREQQVEGVVITSFTVEADGSIGQLEVLKSPDPSLAAEALRVLKNMPAWVPGEKDGKAVAYEYKLPVSFKLPVGEMTPGEKVLQKVDEMPRFPGCEELTDAAERQQCANRELLKFVFSRIRYPEAAKNAGIEGTAVVRFVIDKEGNVTDPQVVRSLGNGTDEEILRIMEAMPQWIPGRHQGAPAAVEFNLPVRFKLSEDEKAAIADTNNRLELRAFNLAPNPSNGQLNLRFEAAAAPTTIRITDLSGRELFSQQLNDFDGHYQSTIDLSSAARGTVLLLVQQGDKVYSEKVVLQ